ncbi:hypothetical protein H4R34_006418, partial [Dimargaris verticillata]
MTQALTPTASKPAAVAPVAQTTLAIPLGLPAAFFQQIDPAHDPEYQRDDALYPT